MSRTKAVGNVLAVIERAMEGILRIRILRVSLLGYSDNETLRHMSSVRDIIVTPKGSKIHSAGHVTLLLTAGGRYASSSGIFGKENDQSADIREYSPHAWRRWPVAIGDKPPRVERLGIVLSMWLRLSNIESCTLKARATLVKGCHTLVSHHWQRSRGA